MLIINSITACEQPFSRNSYFGELGTEPPYTLIEGSVPVLLSAPHAINQYREGAIKPADMFTGALLLCVQKLTRCHAIYSSSFSLEDPNYILGGEYKAALAGLIQAHSIPYVIDIHGAAESRDFDVDLGTLHGASIQQQEVNRIVQLFHTNGIRMVEQNHTFAASHPGTITSFCSRELQVQSIQMEINRRYRNPEAPMLLQSTVDSLVQIVNLLGGV
ncbi:N-formylglutamate amidohydrolase [Paenibacillus donghaensis]|uniref:Succinylglutamate desuccinylase n=1 Tax=Paenibacillus donghaensis TaxID=414771 RepID=A0A2Z2KVD0_9BACL|nr:N-formylglutamate amidohydrolase [Paenibacillus donghaensis]ASA25191.1 hypothetical protein B9T62_33345 [Paenibacillus donghaensis]